ncbi:substrate-binding domain-containing protein [Paenibacillus monticola]|uniref:substrate-binding domain-containing protein n=1 Tax=Paenibacillus monticola TaxID=2666075 RepID=UPI001E4556A2|nr:substrate-binding domain-containing protein [Paenibacillus monticola]
MEQVSDLFQEHPDLDGVFASSDMLALQVLKQCRRLGKAVPDQVKVIGYDGISVGDMEDLTTIVHPIKKMGELAVRYLLLQIAGEQVPLETILPVRLSEKRTT